MISRFKWYDIRFPCTIEEAFKKLAHYTYDSTRTAWFDVDTADFSFRFYWTTAIFATSIDSSGVSNRNEILSISSQNVHILGTDRLIMRMQDPPRSSRELFNTLERLLGFGFTCEKITITDTLVRRSIESFNSITLASIKISGSVPSMSTIARLELASKNGIEIDKIDHFQMEGKIVESATYITRHKGLSGSVGFSRSGVCKISGDLGGLIQNNVEKYLLNVDSTISRY